MQLKNLNPVSLISSLFDHKKKSDKYGVSQDAYRKNLTHACCVPEMPEFPNDEFDEDYDGTAY
jgi:hypothetical protein